jgi:hypothetical protein
MLSMDSILERFSYSTDGVGIIVGGNFEMSAAGPLSPLVWKLCTSSEGSNPEDEWLMSLPSSL